MTRRKVHNLQKKCYHFFYFADNSYSGFNKEVDMWSNENYNNRVDKALEIIYYDDGHPVRDSIITQDEIINLKILLNTETDIETILQNI